MAPNTLSFMLSLTKHYSHHPFSTNSQVFPTTTSHSKSGICRKSLPPCAVSLELIPTSTTQQLPSSTSQTRTPGPHDHRTACNLLVRNFTSRRCSILVPFVAMPGATFVASLLLPHTPRARLHLLQCVQCLLRRPWPKPRAAQQPLEPVGEASGRAKRWLEG